MEDQKDFFLKNTVTILSEEIAEELTGENMKENMINTRRSAF